MNVGDFDFPLPPELVAQEPPAERDGARLLILERQTGAVTHASFADLPELLAAGDLVVVNNTRVYPARLLGRRVPSGGAVECLLIGRLAADGGCARSAPTEPCSAETGSPAGECWEALMHPGQRLGPGARVVFEGRPAVHAEVLERRFRGRRLIRLWTENGSRITDALERIGHVPLPPYIKRPDRESDRERYQTVFARAPGSVAAPTAGLHFTSGLLTALTRRGIELAEITLHVGYATFQPVHVDRVEEHRIEAERFEVTEAAAAALNRALDAGRRVIAVGTTTTRTLETLAACHEGRIVSGGGATDLFIYPGFPFRVLGGLLTNFHLPRSSLLMLASAFGGPERVLAAYRDAIAARYRFYSYGDAMLIV